MYPVAPRFSVRMVRLAVAFAVVASACTGSVGGGSRPGDPGGNGNSGNGSPSNPSGNNGPGSPGGGMGNMGAPGGANPGGPGNPTNPGGPISTGETFPAQPGHVPLRRLTRTQYNNTIQDLLGIVGDAAAEFGVDEEEGGFASNGRAPLKELQLEKYQQVAEGLADKAVANLGNLLKCEPAAQEAACVESFIRSFGKRAYRRPLTPQEVTRYQSLFTSGRMGGDVASGVSLVVAAMLQSPYFLYRIELGDPAAGKDGLTLTPFEVGTRLSYFLTNSTPDDALLAAAEAAKLRTPDEIGAEARRLLGSPKARETLVSFFEQWLQVDDLLTVEKDAKAYPEFNPEVRAAMRDELREVIDQVARVGDGKLETLLTTRATYIRRPLYPIYGMPLPGVAGGSILKRVDLPADQRSGVFTLAGVLAKFGHADQSSPVGRGLLLSESLLCAVPPPPPPGADNDIPAVDPNVPTRLRFEKHRTKPECASCHALMDPLGVAFENYDGVGRHRTTDGGKPVDATSELKGTKASDGPVKNAIDLLGKLATAEETRACFARQMFRYAFGRSEGDLDSANINEARTALDRTGRIPDLMVAIATAPGFRTRIALDK